MHVQMGKKNVRPKNQEAEAHRIEQVTLSRGKGGRSSGSCSSEEDGVPKEIERIGSIIIPIRDVK